MSLSTRTALSAAAEAGSGQSASASSSSLATRTAPSAAAEAGSGQSASASSPSAAEEAGSGQSASASSSTLDLGGFELDAWLEPRRRALEATLAGLFPSAPGLASTVGNAAGTPGSPPPEPKAAPGAAGDPLDITAWRPPRFVEALRYPLETGGKRVRPALCFAAYEALAAQPHDLAPALPAAVALELVHTYSLVHDDLPSMDDDELRRGRPTVHVAFDEATAILVGDALLTEAFAVLARGGGHGETRARMVAVLATAAGHAGMVGGQAIDIALGGGSADLETLTRLHRGKTGALITAAVELGGLAAGADPGELALLRRYGAAVGLAFQLADDVLDADQDRGGDGSPSFVRVLGVDATRARAQALAAEAGEVALALGPAHRVAPLLALAHFTVAREA